MLANIDKTLSKLAICAAKKEIKKKLFCRRLARLMNIKKVQRECNICEKRGYKQAN